jgi:hypothetical protein
MSSPNNPHIPREQSLAMYHAWQIHGSLRGADPEVMEEIGIFTPERYAEMFRPALDAAEVSLDKPVNPEHTPVEIDETHQAAEEMAKITGLPSDDFDRRYY